MSRKYYYLVSGLPNLVESVKGFDYLKIREEIVELLAKEDEELLKLLLLRFDNENIINFLDKKEEFDSRGWFGAAQLEDAISDPTELPNYLQVFLQNRKEEKENVSGQGSIAQLFQLYYREIADKNAWFAEWADFCADIQNVVAAINARQLGIPVEKSVIPFNDNAEKITKSRAADFGLGHSLPWFEQISKNINNPILLEEAIDEIYWKKVDELSISPDCEFGIESVLGFMVKANSIERWLRLDTEEGMARAQRLIDNLKLSLQK